MWHCGVQKLLVSLSKRVIDVTLKTSWHLFTTCNNTVDLPHTIKSLLYTKGLQRIFRGSVKLINGKNWRQDALYLGFEMFWINMVCVCKLIWEILKIYWQDVMLSLFVENPWITQRYMLSSRRQNSGSR